jgi:N-acyl-D-aspartate/D-glutamate deacylase
MPSRGIRYTIVNGACVFVEGELTQARAGQVLRS